jgi:hypothetical protein
LRPHYAAKEVQTSGLLVRSQRNVVIAAYLGWTLDAFDFFLMVFMFKDISMGVPSFLLPKATVETPRISRCFSGTQA